MLVIVLAHSTCSNTVKLSYLFIYLPDKYYTKYRLLYIFKLDSKTEDKGKNDLKLISLVVQIKKWRQLTSIGAIWLCVTPKGQITNHFMEDLKRLAYWK